MYVCTELYIDNDVEIQSTEIKCTYIGELSLNTTITTKIEACRMGRKQK